jgi:tetratricopeptide (TPR) repeat protein
MNEPMSAQTCAPDMLDRLLKTVSVNENQGLLEIETALRNHPNDAQLHFLKGSVLASAQRYDEGRDAIRRAITIAPDYALARFQLGFLELTSGLPAAAVNTWEPLDQLADDNPLRIFANGLGRLAVDDFASALSLLEAGIAVNHEHPLINNDMQLIIDECRAKRAMSDEKEVSVPLSAAQQLFQSYEVRDSGGYRKT